MTLVKVTRERLGDTEEVETASGQSLVYSSRAPTLIDAVEHWSRFDSLPGAYDWMRDDMQSGRIRAADLDGATIRFGKVSTIRRIGTWLEILGTSEPVLRQMQDALTPTTAKIPLIPDRPVRGRLMKRWGVVIND